MKIFPQVIPEVLLLVPQSALFTAVEPAIAAADMVFLWAITPRAWSRAGQRSQPGGSEHPHGGRIFELIEERAGERIAKPSG
jgi:hypothetical protein